MDFAMNMAVILTSISIVMKTEIATGATIKAVEGFDAAALKKAETVEKNSLPDQEGMAK